MAEGNSKRKHDKKCKPRGVASKGTRVGARRARLSRLELALLGKGPTQAAAQRMYRESAKGAKR